MRSNTGNPTPSSLKSEIEIIQKDDDFIESGHKENYCNITPYILMFALSVHSVFEGIAVGLQREPADVWNLAVAIGLHKWADAMSLGISMSSNLEHSSFTVHVLILIFSLATPIGVLIGIIIMDTHPLINIIFQGLAGGTFLYISASEVVVEEFSVPKNKWLKMCGFVVGAAIIIMVTSVEDKEFF